MNIVIYARFSSHSQTEQSIEGQLKVCYEYAERNNMTVIQEYIDRATTGTNDNRQQFQQMLEDSNKKQFEAVLVYQLDRFARNRYDSAINKRKLKLNGVRVISAREPISDDAPGVLLESMLEGFAEFYSVDLSQKIRRGMNVSVDKRQTLGGRCPLGFKVDKNTKKYVIDDDTAPIVKQIFEMYAKDINVAEIVKYLNANNYKTSIGGNFNKNSLNKLLQNKKYIGSYVYKGNELEKDVFPQIVSFDIFEMVQRRMNKARKAPATTKAYEDYILTTKLFCGHCKNMMVGVSGTSKTGKKHCYYTCNGVKKKICKKKSVQKAYIENLVLTECRKVLTDENIEKIANKVMFLIEQEKDTEKVRILRHKLKKCNVEKQNLLKSLKDGASDTIRRIIFEEIEKLDNNSKIIQKEIDVETMRALPIEYSEIKFFLTNIRNGNIEDLKYQKALIAVLINKIYLYDDKMTIVFNTQNTPVEISSDLISKAESSFLTENAPPFKTSGTHKISAERRFFSMFESSSP